MNLFKTTYLNSDSTLTLKVEKFIEHWFDKELFIETRTSGSTGKPKIIRLEKAKMYSSAKMTGAYFNFQKHQKVLLCLSPDSIGGKMLILRAILHEMELLVTDVNRNPMKEIDFELDFVSMVPMQVQTILNENPQKLNLVRNLLIGGAAVSPAIEMKLKSLKTNVFESFGMTETMSHVAVKKLNDGDKSTFEALPGISFSLLAEKLTIHAPTLGLPNLETNDVVNLIDATHFIWKGRADFAINSGGLKFHPEIIEKKLATDLQHRFFISSEKDELLGERIVLVVENCEQALTQQKIQQILMRNLASYEIPKQIYCVDKFVETASGKINRKATILLIPGFKF